RPSAHASHDAGLVRNDLERDPIEVRQPGPPVVRVALQNDLAAGGPMVEHERAGADSRASQVAVLLDRFLRHDLAAFELGEHAEYARKWFGEAHLHRVWVDHVDRLDR